MTAPTTDTTDTTTDLPCVTQDPEENPPAEALAVCTGKGEILSESTINGKSFLTCRPCRAIAVRNGWAR